MVTTSPLALVVKCFIALVPVGVRFCLESQPLWVMYFVWTQARIKGRVQVLSRLPFKKSHPRTALPLDMFYSYVRTLPRRCWSSLSLNQTNLICWDRSGQMVRRLLFLYFFHRLQRWQKQRGQLGVCVCVCVCVCVKEGRVLSETDWQCCPRSPLSLGPWQHKLSVLGHLWLSAREGRLPVTARQHSIRRSVRVNKTLTHARARLDWYHS